jgi:hypothetical protein
MDMPVIKRAAKAPVRAKGTDIITTRGKTSDSNCMAMTTKTKKTEIKSASPMEPNSVIIMRMDSPAERLTPSGSEPDADRS